MKSTHQLCNIYLIHSSMILNNAINWVSCIIHYKSALLNGPLFSTIKNCCSYILIRLPVKFRYCDILISLTLYYCRKHRPTSWTPWLMSRISVANWIGMVNSLSILFVGQWISVASNSHGQLFLWSCPNWSLTFWYLLLSTNLTGT